MEKSLVQRNEIQGSSAADPLPLPSSSSCLPPLQKVSYSSEIVEEASLETQSSEHLIPDVPKLTNGSAEDFVRISTPPPASPTPKRVNFSPLPSPSHLKFNESPGPSSSKGKPSMKILIPKLSFKIRNPNADIEKAAMLALGYPSDHREKATMRRTFSLSKLFTPRMKKTSSLPVSPSAHSNPESTHGGNGNPTDIAPLPKVTQYSIHRSRSVPVLNKDGSVRQTDYANGVIRVIPATPRVAEHNPPTSCATFVVGADEIPNDGEDIPQEEAVCRICLVELGEGSDTLKMECYCKGELALAHEDCAVKWFSIKGNKTCDVCNQEVKNLPVTLLRLPNGQPRGNGGRLGETTRYRVWQDVPVLVIVSMLAYFCFLEQLLVTKMGSGAIAISLPFSCILGLLASMTSTTMVRRQFAWMYATIQFVLVVLFAHVFYSLLHVQAVLAVLLATFAGFGGAMCGTSILFELLKWRRSWRAFSSQPNTSQDHSPDNNQVHQMDPEQQRNEVASPRIGHGS